MKKEQFVIFLILILLCTSLINCTGFMGKAKERDLAVIELPGKSYKLKLAFYPSDATIQASIQVKKVYENKKEDLLNNYERYNFVDTFYFENVNTFILIIRDTASRLGNKPDTMQINLD